MRIAIGISVPLICAALFLIVVYTVILPSTNKTVPLSQALAGDMVAFGSYEQDNNTSNGAEAIEWLVLDVQGGKALLISRECLDARPYHEENESVTWEDSTLRGWLNDTFFIAAFSGSEQSAISQTQVENPDNPEYGTGGGRDTLDRVFLLSISETQRYLDSERELLAKPTPYAVARGASEWYDNNAVWWLRSPGRNDNLAAYVNDGANIGLYGDYVYYSNFAVRPALWVKL